MLLSAFGSADVGLPELVDEFEFAVVPPLAPPELLPHTRNLIVVQGAKTTSSWSIPIMFEPLGLKTPTTRKDTFETRISLPIGDSSGNNSRTIVVPMTHDLMLPRTSRSVNMSPASMLFQTRTTR